MANVKITGLTAITAPANTDVLPIVDVSADVTKKVSIADLLESAGDGTAALPAFAFDSDKDIGMYRVGANQLGFATNGTSRIVVDASGNVGVGTTSPQASLTIGAVNSSVEDIVVHTSNNGNARLRFREGGSQASGFNEYSFGMVGNANALTFEMVGVGEAMRIDSSGNVGIGETSIDALLVIKGNSDASTTPSIRLKDGSDTREAWISNSAGDLILANGGNDNTPHCLLKMFDGNVMTFGTANTERMRIDSSGNVGIGTTAPAAKTHISKSYSAPTGGHDGNLSLVVSNSGSANNFNGIGITAGNNGGSFIHFGDTDDDNVGAVAYFHDSNSLAFTTNASERLRIDNLGRVGIGNSSMASFNSSFNNLVVGSGSGNEGITVYSGNADQGYIAFNDAANDSVRGLIEYNHNGDYMGLRTNGTERMRIYADGGVSFKQYLEFANPAGGFAGYIGSAGIIAAAGSSNDLAVRSGQHLVFTAGGSTEKMRILSSGNVGIGTTSPSGLLSIHQATSSTSNYINITNNATGASSWSNGMLVGVNATGEAFCWQNENNNLKFGTNNQERMLIAGTGRVGINDATDAFAEALQVTGFHSGQYAIAAKITASSGSLMRFGNAGGVCGSITCGTSSTAYNTSSDYRLKENVVDLTAAIPRLKTLPVHRFNFITDGEITVDGFLAHEAQLVVPEAVTGTKDEVDEKGNAVMQCIDNSKLVPLLTAALQEAITEIDDLKKRVKNLES